MMISLDLMKSLEVRIAGDSILSSVQGIYE